MNWRARRGGPKGIPKVGPHVCPRPPKKGPPGGTPRTRPGRAKLKKGVPGTPQKGTSNRGPEPEPNSRKLEHSSTFSTKMSRIRCGRTPQKRLPKMDRSGDPLFKILDSEVIFRVPPGVPPGALIMTFWVLKWGLLFEALELPRGARKQKRWSRGPLKN